MIAAAANRAIPETKGNDMKNPSQRLLPLAAALALIASGPARALDPVPDVMGVYLDDQAMNLCINTSAPYTTPTAYLMIVNMSGSQMKAFECTIDMETNFAVPSFTGAWQLSGPGIDVGGPEDANHDKVYAVGYGTAQLPDADGNLILATRSPIVPDATNWMTFLVKPYPDSQSFGDAPGYAPDVGIAIPCLVPNGSYVIPQTYINVGDCWGAPAEPMSWGQVKSLY